MFSEDLRIGGIDPIHARNLYALLTLKESRARHLPMAFALLDAGETRHLVVGNRRAAMPRGFDRITAKNAEAIAAALGVRLLVAVEEESLRDIVEDVQSRWTHGDDQLVQVEVVLDRLRIAIEDGDAILWPDFFTVALRMNAAAMHRFLDTVFPPSTSVILYLFRKQAVHSSLVAVRGPRHIEAITGHWSIMDRLGTYHPWRDGYQRILEAVKEVHAPPSLGFFGEYEVVKDMIHAPRPGQLSRAILDRSVIIDPMPGWMAATLGVDAISRAARLSLRLIEKVDRLGLSKRFDLDSVRHQVKSQIDRQVDFEMLMGFDPFDYFSKFLRWWSG